MTGVHKRVNQTASSAVAFRAGSMAPLVMHGVKRQEII